VPDMTETERTLVVRQIASIIDSPSVYMGGPSPSSTKKAERIVSNLEAAFRLTASKCGHGSWESYRQHGIYCPTCGMAFRAPENDHENIR
jgi:hypothetical protein